MGGSIDRGSSGSDSKYGPTMRKLRKGVGAEFRNYMASNPDFLTNVGGQYRGVMQNLWGNPADDTTGAMGRLLGGQAYGDAFTQAFKQMEPQYVDMLRRTTAQIQGQAGPMGNRFSTDTTGQQIRAEQEGLNQLAGQAAGVATQLYNTQMQGALGATGLAQAGDPRTAILGYILGTSPAAHSTTQNSGWSLGVGGGKGSPKGGDVAAAG